MVKKVNGNWQIYIDFTDLNQACPEDNYPLSKIDQMVDATSGNGLLSIINAFFGYYQIQMAPENEEITTFIEGHFAIGLCHSA